MGTRLACHSLALGCALALAGCTHLKTSTRTERGPVLRVYERDAAPLPGGVRAQAAARWPQLELSLFRFDLCRKEKVEEYAEERITERSAPLAGPAIAMGSAYTLLGTGLFFGGFLLSDAPNTRTIDVQGRYGPSDRQIATGWSIALVALGIPALATGLLEAAQVGETTELLKGEQVISALEAPCRERPASGKLALLGGMGLPAPRPLEDGKLSLPAEALRQGQLDALLLDGREVDLAREDVERVKDFAACARVLLPEAGGGQLPALDVEELRARLELAHQCRKVPGAPAEEAVGALEKELAARAPEEPAEP